MTRATAAAAAMSERELENSIRAILTDLSLRWYHTFDSRRSPSGYPDLTIVGRRGVMWRELKTQRGRVTPEQQVWLDTLAAAGSDAAVWRPDSLLSGQIARELSMLAGLRAVRGNHPAGRRLPTGGPDAAA
jgi:VRR-NUC domain